MHVGVDSVMFGVSSWRESLICVYVNKQVWRKTGWEKDINLSKHLREIKEEWMHCENTPSQKGTRGKAVESSPWLISLKSSLCYLGNGKNMALLCSVSLSASATQLTLSGHFPGDSEGKSICLQCRRPGFNPWVGKITWRRKWQPTPNPVDGGAWLATVHGSCKESDTTERLHFTYSLGG